MGAAQDLEDRLLTPEYRVEYEAWKAKLKGKVGDDLDPKDPSLLDMRLMPDPDRARVRVYAALVVRDMLSERVVKLLALNVDAGWRSFEAFFAEDIRRIIQRNLPGPDREQDRLDAYQTVCEALLKNDMQRLRAYSGDPSA